jgi:hypothetical protein
MTEEEGTLCLTNPETGAKECQPLIIWGSKTPERCQSLKAFINFLISSIKGENKD